MPQTFASHPQLEVTINIKPRLLNPRYNPATEAINHRFAQAHIAYGKLSALWKASVPQKTRLIIFRSYVVSVLLYGLCTLTLEDKHLKKIDGWYFQFLRRVVGITASYCSRITNKAVWLRAEQPILPSQMILKEQLQQLIINQLGYSAQ